MVQPPSSPRLLLAPVLLTLALLFKPGVAQAPAPGPTASPLSPAGAAALAPVAPSSISPIDVLFVFGDSLVDTGNNQFLNASASPQKPPVPVDPPYGQDYPGLTGRFSNGRVIVDHLAQKLGLPFAPPYLNKSASFRQGVNFASAGSGVLNTTNAAEGVLSLAQQLVLFQGYRNQLIRTSRAFLLPGQPQPILLGPQSLSTGLFVLATGANDLSAFTGTAAEFPAYVSRMVAGIINFLKATYALGARRVLLYNVPNLGCTPIVRLTNKGACLPSVSLATTSYNFALAQAVTEVEAVLPGLVVVYVDAFGTLDAILANETALGFTNANSSCCGGGPPGSANTLVFCGSPTPLVANGVTYNWSVCATPSTYVFWDIEHPTDAAAGLVATESFLGDQFVMPAGLSTAFQAANGAINSTSPLLADVGKCLANVTNCPTLATKLNSSSLSGPVTLDTSAAICSAACVQATQVLDSCLATTYAKYNVTSDGSAASNYSYASAVSSYCQGVCTTNATACLSTTGSSGGGSAFGDGTQWLAMASVAFALLLWW